MFGVFLFLFCSFPASQVRHLPPRSPVAAAVSPDDGADRQRGGEAAGHAEVLLHLPHPDHPDRADHHRGVHTARLHHAVLVTALRVSLHFCEKIGLKSNFVNI